MRRRRTYQIDAHVARPIGHETDEDLQNRGYREASGEPRSISWDTRREARDQVRAWKSETAEVPEIYVGEPYEGCDECGAAEWEHRERTSGAAEEAYLVCPRFVGSMPGSW